MLRQHTHVPVRSMGIHLDFNGQLAEHLVMMARMLNGSRVATTCPCARSEHERPAEPATFA